MHGKSRTLDSAGGLSAFPELARDEAGGLQHVEPGALAQVVAADEEVEGARELGALPEAADEARVRPDDIDRGGELAVLGVVEHDDILGPHRVQVGDVVLALPSSGLHSNGYSLVRRVVAAAGWDWDRHVDELGRTIGEECLEPTRIYTRALLDVAALRPAVDRFFTEVFVMVEDPALRQARLALLADLRDTVRAIADLSSIAGPQA